MNAANKKLSEAIGVADDSIDTLLKTENPEDFKRIAMISLQTIQRLASEALKLKKE